MATKKNATKHSERAQVDLGGLEEVKVSKRSSRRVKKELKQINTKTWIFAIVFLIVGIGAGVGAWFFACKDDCFYLNGKDEITLTLAEEDRYVDEGVTIVAFGKDATDSITIETNLKVDENGKYYAEDVGTYYIKYVSSNLKYGSIFKVEKVRLVTFVEISEGGE